ncbi:MAG: hypothetical protein WCE62_18880 [Polyangiales bacterium]
MNHFAVALGLFLLAVASACGTPEQVQRMEMQEDMEQTMGNERSAAAAEGDGMDGFMGPNAEEQIEMQTEPYPE